MQPIDDGESGSSIRSKLNQLIKQKNTFASPLEFGAKFDGETDDTDAIQAAIDTGKHVILPQGITVISRPLSVRKLSGRMFEGQGRGATTIMQRTDNCAVFIVSGTRLVFKNLLLTWKNVQTELDGASVGFDVVEKTEPDGILATSRFESIAIKNCAIGFDFTNAIGYSNTLVDFGVTSFAISAIFSDERSGFTQCRFDSIYIQNQPAFYLRGKAKSGSRSSITLPSDMSPDPLLLKGTSLVIEGGRGAGSTVRWITNYDHTTGRVDFFPPADVQPDSTSRFQIARIGKSKDAPFRLQNFTDALIGMIAFEFIRLSEGCPSPLVITSCATVNVLQCRYERISFGAPYSALISASGRSVVRLQSLQTQYSAALGEVGVLELAMSQTHNQAVVEFGTIEADNWIITCKPTWARLKANSPEGRKDPPWGGAIFDQVPSGDGTFHPHGQAFSALGPQRQTAIIGRPRREQRGVRFLTEPPPLLNVDLMRDSDIIRFDAPLRHDVTVLLDLQNAVTGASVVISRSTNCPAPFEIIVKSGMEELVRLKEANTSAEMVCDGESYFVL